MNIILFKKTVVCFKIPVTIEDGSVYKQIKNVLLANNFKKVADPSVD